MSKCGTYYARTFFPGWTCTRNFHTEGPCALIPRWWNLKAKRRFRR